MEKCIFITTALLNITKGSKTPLIINSNQRFQRPQLFHTPPPPPPIIWESRVHIYIQQCIIYIYFICYDIFNLPL